MLTKSPKHRIDLFSYTDRKRGFLKKEKEYGLGTEIRKKWISPNIPLNLHLHKMQLTLKLLSLV